MPVGPPAAAGPVWQGEESRGPAPDGQEPQGSAPDGEEPRSPESPGDDIVRRRNASARLGDDIAKLAARIQAATYELLVMLREFDARQGWAGFPSCAHWLHWRTGLAPGPPARRCASPARWASCRCSPRPCGKGSSPTRRCAR